MPPSKTRLEQINNVFRVGSRDLKVLCPLHDRRLIQCSLAQREGYHEPKRERVLMAQIILANKSQERVHRHCKVVNEFVDGALFQVTMYWIFLLPCRNTTLSMESDKIYSYTGTWQRYLPLGLISPKLPLSSRSRTTKFKSNVLAGFLTGWMCKDPRWEHGNVGLVCF